MQRNFDENIIIKFKLIEDITYEKQNGRQCNLKLFNEILSKTQSSSAVKDQPILSLQSVLLM